MIRFVLAFVLALALTGPARAQDAAIQTVIGDQIEAFKVDDFAKAFTYASPAIRRIFGTPERFGLMVRQGFPMVWRPADVQYLDQVVRGGLTYQKVLIKDGSGTLYTLEYEMIPVSEGWQINGVQFLVDPPVAA